MEEPKKKSIGELVGRIAFHGAAGLVTLLILALGSLHGIASPWVQELWISSEEGVMHPEMHFWHDGEWGAMGVILLAGSMVALQWRPGQKTVVAQFLAVAAVILATVYGVFAPVSGVIFLALIGLVVALHPERRAVFGTLFSRDARLSGALLAAGLLPAPFLLAEAFGLLRLQIDGAGGEHLIANHWLMGVVVNLSLIAAGALTATRRPGWKVLGSLAGLAYLYLGATAIRVADNPGSWGTAWGGLALVYGIVYLGVIGALSAERTALSAGRVEQGA